MLKNRYYSLVMAKPPFAVGRWRYSSEPINSNRRKGSFLKAEGVECRLSESDGPICGKISTAILVRWLTTHVHCTRTARPVTECVQVLIMIAYARKCQAIAKQPCLVTERATENDGCNSSVWMGRTCRRAK